MHSSWPASALLTFPKAGQLIAFNLDNGYVMGQGRGSISPCMVGHLAIIHQFKKRQFILYETSILPGLHTLCKS